jgi:hypothetical protein
VIHSKKNRQREKSGLCKLILLYNAWQCAKSRLYPSLLGNRMQKLGVVLTHEKKYPEAEPLLVQSYVSIKAQFGAGHERTRRAASRLINLYNLTGKKDRAAAITAELEGQK